MTEEIGKEGVSRRGFMQTTGAIAAGAMAHFTILNPAAQDAEACDECPGDANGEPGDDSTWGRVYERLESCYADAADDGAYIKAD